MSRKLHRIAAAGALAIAVSIPLAPVVSGAVAADRPTQSTGLRGVSMRAAQTIEVTSSNLAEVKAMAKTTPVVFLVTAPSWCSACQDLDPKIKQIAGSTDGWILAIVDQDKAGGADKDFKVEGFPTMVPWGASGEMSNPARHVGSGEASVLQSWVDSVKSAYGPGPAPAPTQPTEQPTEQPTADPTVDPTVDPTDPAPEPPQPTVDPTDPAPRPPLPTNLPTGLPTALPTGLPGNIDIAQIIALLKQLGILDLILGGGGLGSIDWSQVDMNALKHATPSEARHMLQQHSQVPLTQAPLTGRH